MRWITSQLGQLIIEPQSPVDFSSPDKGIIELVADSAEIALYPALWMAKSVKEGALVWCHRDRPPYFPSIAQQSDRTILWVRGDTAAAVECLRCKAVGAMIYQPGKLSSIESRRLQLAAEQSGAMGILIRKTNSQANYAATARYHVAPARGDPLVQRWSMQLLHGHGRRAGEIITLELCRETNYLHPSAIPADRSGHSQRSFATG